MQKSNTRIYFGFKQTSCLLQAPFFLYFYGDGYMDRCMDEADRIGSELKKLDLYKRGLVAVML